jgi:MFS family permease
LLDDHRRRRPGSALQARSSRPAAPRGDRLSTVGTTIEWYDFLVYGQMAALVFAKLYFLSSDPLTGTLQAFAVFAVGFVARPIGAAIFGHYGDRIGRKAALIATLRPGGRFHARPPLIGRLSLRAKRSNLMP